MPKKMTQSISVFKISLFFFTCSLWSSVSLCTCLLSCRSTLVSPKVLESTVACKCPAVLWCLANSTRAKRRNFLAPQLGVHFALCFLSYFCRFSDHRSCAILLGEVYPFYSKAESKSVEVGVVDLWICVTEVQAHYTF